MSLWFGLKTVFKRWLWGAALCIACSAGTPAAQHQSSSGLTVATDKGPVRGLLTGGIRAFSGVPFAARPVGALRFAAPAPHAVWTRPLDATRPGSVCPQFGPPSYPFGHAQTTSEDCLTLNVTAPSSGSALPVMVWIHGGYFTQGSGAFYPATRLVTGGHTVVVTINYRLGILGFLANPALDAKGTAGTGNYGIEDQIAALGWVRRNIAAFGGNPDKVTIAGESAGALSVCELIANAAAGGPATRLFVRGIAESGPCQSPIKSIAMAERTGKLLAVQLGCPGSGTRVAACLRGLPLATILKVQRKLAVSGLGPSVGGPDLPRQPRTAIGSIPMLLGGNALEWGLFVALGLPPPPATPSAYAATLRTVYGADAGASVAHSTQYRWARFDGNGFLALSSAMSDFAPSVSVAICDDVVTWQKQAATTVPIYAYEFSDPNAPVPLPFAPFEAMLAAGPIHAAELQYLFPNLASPFSATAHASGLPLPPAERALSAAMIRYWTSFVATGNPNASGLPHWPIYRKPTDALQLSDGSVGIRTGVDVDAEHHCSSFWKPLDAPAGLLK